MKKEFTYKNIIDYLLGAFFVAWMAFEVVLVGNKFDVLHATDFSGQFVLIFGACAPGLTVYVLLKMWGDIKGPRDFFSLLFSCKKTGMTILMVIVFCVIQFGVSLFFAMKTGQSFLMIPLYFLYALLFGGLGEIGWRGFLQPALEQRLPFYLANLMTGSLWACFAVPLWYIDGTLHSQVHFARYVLYCVFLSILLNALYGMTESVLACIIFQAFSRSLVFLFEGLVFNNGKLTLIYSIEMLLATVICFVIRKKNRKIEK